jgi:flagellar assembly factor FliW
MSVFATAQFGPVEYKDEAVWEFPHGLPAFEDQTRFLPIERPGYSPIVFLQSLLQPELCFLTLPVQILIPDYRLNTAAEDLMALGLGTEAQPGIGEEVLCLAILSVTGNQPPTANLLAPVVVNLKNRRAVQAVRLDSVYSHQHPLAVPEPVGRLEGNRCL